MSDITKVLHDVQQKLHAPKGQTNNFGKYKYRSCEDIVEAVKPLLAEHGACLILSDELVNIGDRYYIKSDAILSVGGTIECRAHGYARETETRKGMDESQITGTASSYARKYALNGLFAIDDTKDADSETVSKEPRVKFAKGVKDKVLKDSLEYLESGDSDGLKQVWAEFDADEKVALWPMFNSTQRRAITELMKGV